MKVKELILIIFDNVIIYKSKDEEFGEFEDIYKGDTNGISLSLLEMKVRSVGAGKEGYVDIEIH